MASAEDLASKARLKQQREQDSADARQRWQDMTPSMYERGAEMGVASSMHNLGMCYVYGRGTAKDKERGRKWLLKAAAKSLAPSYHELGVMNLAELSFEEAAQNFEQAIAFEMKTRSRSNSEWELGNLYAQGQGVSRDIRRALELVESSARQECALEPHIQKERDQKVSELQESLRKDCPLPPEIGDKVIVITLLGQVGFVKSEPITIKAKMKTLLSQVLNAFASEKGVSVASLRAISPEGMRLKPAMSLHENGLSDGDAIDIAHDVDGGGACCTCLDSQ